MRIAVLPPPKARMRPLGNESLALFSSSYLPRRKVLRQTSTATTDNTRAKGQGRNYLAANIIDGDSNTYWATDDGQKTAEIILKWNDAQNVHYVTLMEYIQLGQRVKAFTIETSMEESTWTSQGGDIQTTTIGYKRIIPLNGQTGT